MNWIFKLYLITRLDALQAICIAGLILAGLATIVFFIARIDAYDEDEYEKKYGKPLKRYWQIGVPLFSLLLVFIPTRDDIILIYAGGSAIEYVKSDSSLQKIPYKATELILNKIDEKVKEIEKK